MKKLLAPAEGSQVGLQGFFSVVRRRSGKARSLCFEGGHDDQIYVHVGHVDANGFNLAGPNR